jgi:outer membrane immunogenic protein
MRKLLHTMVAAAALLALSMSANAADVGAQPRVYTPPPVYVPPPLFSWTGFYIGGNFGGAWNHQNVTDSLFGLNFSNASNNGVFMGGGQAGFNYQFSNIVLGVEWDIDWAGNNDNTNSGISVSGIGPIQVSSNNGWITTLAGRFGVAYDNWFFYGKAGGGWVGNNNVTITSTTTGASVTIFNNNKTNSGWLVGAGIEWALASNWSVKIEYDYLGLSSRTFVVPAGGFFGGDTFTTSNPNVQMAKVGFNYLFNYGVGRY